MDVTHIRLAYGHQEMPLNIPTDSLFGVYSPQPINKSVDEKHLIRHAMTNPIGTLPLSFIVQPGKKIAIITSDMTRPTPSGRMLPYILDELQAAGIPDEDIIIVLALGLHRKMTLLEIEAVLSLDILQRYRVINHDPEDVVHLGVTSFGTPVEIFRPVIEADVRICLGNIEFHYFAGYSGGAKAILPGCASRECITANHSHMVEAMAIAGRVTDNPVRMDLEEGVAMVGVDFILNVVLDSQHNIVGAFAGDVCSAHRQGCQMVAQRGGVEIPDLGDIVIASAGGYPKDINFYQAHKALENAKYFVRPGGTIILLAECSEGIGNKTMEQWMLEMDDPIQALDKIKAKFVIGGHKVAAIGLVEKRATIYCVSHLPDIITKRMKFNPFSTVQEALDAALEKVEKQNKVIVLPEASSILPILK